MPRIVWVSQNLGSLVFFFFCVWGGSITRATAFWAILPSPYFGKLPLIWGSKRYYPDNEESTRKVEHELETGLV